MVKVRAIVCFILKIFSKLDFVNKLNLTNTKKSEEKLRIKYSFKILFFDAYSKIHLLQIISQNTKKIITYISLKMYRTSFSKNKTKFTKFSRKKNILRWVGGGVGWG